MARRKTSVMACVHCLQHIQCFRASNLSNNDPLRSHSQCGFDKITDGYLTFSGSVGISCFQTYDIINICDLKLRRVLDRYDTFIPWNEIRHGVEKRCFSRACTPTDKDIILGSYQFSQKIRCFRCNGTIFQKLVYRHRSSGKLSDGHNGARQGKRRQDHVYTGAVCQSCIYDRIGFIDLFSNRPYHLLNDISQLIFAGKFFVQSFQSSCTLHKNVEWSVDHDLCNTVICKDLIQDSHSTDGTEYQTYDPGALLRAYPVIHQLMVYNIRNSSSQLFIVCLTQSRRICYKKTPDLIDKTSCHLF